MFVRGGDSDFNKVLIDGIPANDVGGAVEFGNTCDDRVQPSRDSSRPQQCVLYGSDGLGSVISITTRRGSTAAQNLLTSWTGGSFGDA